MSRRTVDVFDTDEWEAFRAALADELDVAVPAAADRIIEGVEARLEGETFTRQLGGPSIRSPNDSGNFVVETTDGERIEAAGIERSWRTDYNVVYPADPDVMQRSLTNDEIARIGLTNPAEHGVPAWFEATDEPRFEDYHLDDVFIGDTWLRLGLGERLEAIRGGHMDEYLDRIEEVDPSGSVLHALNQRRDDLAEEADA